MESPNVPGRVVIVIINHRPDLTEYEKISLRQCRKVLSAHTIWMVVPENIPTDKIEREFDSLNILPVKSSYLSDYRNFNRFKIDPFLYNHFQDYDYLLYYELDAFVFNDALPYWCGLDLDYIGAPWLKIGKSGEAVFEGVGNGGLSLRKIASHLRVLRTYKKMDSNREILDSYRNFSFKGKISYAPQLLQRILGIKGNTHWRFNDYKENEDIFWSVRVPAVLPWFKVADPMTAMKFSFELLPEVLFRINQRNLPFGCHYWYKPGQLEFWKEFVEKEGYALP